MLAAEAERRGEPFRRLVLLCGARPGWAAADPDLFGERLATEVLLVRADRDSVTGPDGAMEMAKLFQAPQLAAHPGNHAPLPGAQHGREATDALVRRLLDFILEETGS